MLARSRVIWGVTVDGTRYISNSSTITIGGLNGVINYSYDCYVTSANGTVYACNSSCSGVIRLTSQLSKLHVEGNEIKDQTGNALILRGVNVHDNGQEYMYLNPGYKLLDESDFKYLAEQWQVKIVRLPVLPYQWRSIPTYLTQILEPEVQWANKYGIYAIISWQADGSINAPGGGNSSDQSRTNLTETMNFWSTISQHFAGRIGVMYEIYNEPGGGCDQSQAACITWDAWRIRAQSLVNAIRGYDPDTLVLIGGFNGGFDLSGVTRNPVDGSNLAYVSHPYPAQVNTSYCPNPTCWDRYFGDASKSHPVIVTEWGYYTPDQHNQYEDCANYAPPNLFYYNGYPGDIMRYLRSGGMSWLAWDWDPFWCPTMLVAWNNYQTTQYGQFVRQALTEFAATPTYAKQ